MAGKIVLNLAMSLDGYIADEDGGYGWITGQGNTKLDTPQQEDYAAFLQTVDIVVMGNKSYEQGFAKDYPTKPVYVATHHPQPNKGNLYFITGDIVDTVNKERADGKNIYLFGGGLLVEDFIKQNAIDEYIIGIVPVLLGKGRPLFLGGSTAIPLHLAQYSISDGTVILHYTKR